MTHAGTHRPDLLPEWLGIAGVVIFLVVAATHLRHLAMTSGERRPWHLCHVVIAIGMAFMFAPAAIDPLDIPTLSWQLLFAAMAVAAGLRVLAGVTGGASGSPLWLLTAIDLGAMIYMWSSDSFVPTLTWALVVYLVVQSGLWIFNGYRVVDAGAPVISWSAMAPATGGGAVAVSGATTNSLLVGLDISVSMTAMALGMAYMFAAMQLMM